MKECARHAALLRALWAACEPRIRSAPWAVCAYSAGSTGPLCEKVGLMRESSSLMSHSFSHSVLGLAHTYRLFLSFPRWLHDTPLSERRRLGAIIGHHTPLPHSQPSYPAADLPSAQLSYSAPSPLSPDPSTRWRLHRGVRRRVATASALPKAMESF